MALKGKKKSRSRGSQARRRPAAAPRPTYGAGGKPRWYQTTAGLVAAFVVVAVAGILVWWLVAQARSAARDLQAAQDELTRYTESLETVVDAVAPIATDLSTAGELDDDELTRQTRRWRNQLTAAQATVAQASPPAGLEALNGLATQALLLYGQSVEQYALVPELEGDARDSVTANAAASFQAASGIFASSIELLDRERQENEMNASGLTPPGVRAGGMGLPGGTAPSDEIEIPAPEQGDE